MGDCLFLTRQALNCFCGIDTSNVLASNVSGAFDIHGATTSFLGGIWPLKAGQTATVTDGTSTIKLDVYGVKY